MSLLTQTATPVDYDLADANGAVGSSHFAMIKRFAKFALMVSGFFLLILAVMSIKYAAFFLRFAH
jgi:hypothetical protein